ncbi:MAG TPA: glycogen debranching enzyme N-terminal domain-containing protein, partial [Pirellulales bacterium]|nr:glycogen debranching enzyme N-terminal domain-containing protein [Pirellulales bacterium]
MEAATVRRMPWCNSPDQKQSEQRHLLARREWLVTNGLGGYASGTISWSPTRRYHGLLIAALPAPLGRMMMFNHLEEELRVADDRIVRLASDADCNSDRREFAAMLVEFRLEDGLPIWRYQHDQLVLERRVLLPYRSNTVHLTYRLISGVGPAWIRLRPFLHFRPHE